MAGAKGSTRNRGNAETLRRYWSTGKGAARIRWSTPGDFNRCVRLVSKYMTGARGYCNLLHKRATGTWPAQHAKAIRGGRKR